MKVLLEPGMKIKIGDMALANDRWYSVDPYNTGPIYRKDHYPMYRKITTIEELVELFRRSTNEQ